MRHTKEHFRRQRGLYMLIAVLIIAWMLEPSVSTMTEVCRDLILHFYGGSR